MKKNFNLGSCVVVFFFSNSTTLVFSWDICFTEVSIFNALFHFSQIFDISWDLYQPNKLVSCGVKHIKVRPFLIRILQQILSQLRFSGTLIKKKDNDFEI